MEENYTDKEKIRLLEEKLQEITNLISGEKADDISKTINTKINASSKTLEYREQFFSAKGRINRDNYFFRSIIFGIMLTIIPYLYDKAQNTILMFFYFTIFLATIAISMMQKIKRFHDFNSSGWWSIFTLIPIIHIGYWYYLIHKKGNTDPNRFGPVPTKTKHFES